MAKKKTTGRHNSVAYQQALNRSVETYPRDAESNGLKPCPFCDSRFVELSNAWTPSYWIECTVCEAQGGGSYIWKNCTYQAHSIGRRKAITSWNERGGITSGEQS